jgi:hypothetical protein
MRKLILTGALLLSAGAARAQAPASNDFQGLSAWIATQQAHAGTATPVKGKLFKGTYASTSWDFLSYGQAGINVGLASAADYFDGAICMDVATGKVTRYGLSPTVHFGNIWDASYASIPSGIKTHVYMPNLPDVTIAPQFLFPPGGNLAKWRWDADFMLAVGYRFGGLTPQALKDAVAQRQALRNGPAR